MSTEISRKEKESKKSRSGKLALPKGKFYKVDIALVYPSFVHICPCIILFVHPSK